MSYPSITLYPGPNCFPGLGANNGDDHPAPHPNRGPNVVYCPYDDRPYHGTTRKKAEDRASIHVYGQHPEMDNPFECIGY